MAAMFVAILLSNVRSVPAGAQRLAPVGATVASLGAYSSNSPLPLVSEREAGSRRGSHAGWGAVTGALVGGGIAYAQSQRGGAADKHEFDMLNFLILVPLGAGIGALVGLLIP